MSSKSLIKSSELPLNALSRIKQNIPIQLTDITIFDGSYLSMRDQFTQEMKRIDEQMHKFSSDLTLFFGDRASTGQATSMSQNIPVSAWQVPNNCPLVVGEGQDKVLKLQFDVSMYDPSEVNVELLKNMLIVTARHEEKTKDTAVHREYYRQFKLPPGIDLESLLTTLSREGVLTIQAPFMLPATPN